jgi:hypothetical protein
MFAGRRVLPSLAAAATAWVGVYSAPLPAQGNLGFLKDAPISRFKAEDFQLMRQAAATVLASGERTANQSWENTATGNSGLIEALASFSASDGRPCKRLRITNRARGIEEASVYVVCRTPAGEWRIDTAQS